MRYSQSLRVRFTVVCMLLVLTITLLLCSVVYVGQDAVEDQLLMALMQREVDEYARAYHQDHAIAPPRSSLLHGYVVGANDLGDLPPDLREVPPGIHHDILVGGRNFQVANFTLEDRRLYLTYDITQIEQRQDRLLLWLGLGCLAAGLIGGYAGWRLSASVIAPVTQLARQIHGADPLTAEPDFSRRFPGFEVGAIAEAFDAYLRRISAFISRERAFTEDASHELRTPVAVIGTAAERVAADPALPPALQAPLQRMRRASRQMQSVLQALLFLAREDEPDSAELAPVREVIEDSVENCRHLLAERTLRTDIDAAEGESLRIPRGFGAMVIGNLLHNAIAHTAAGEIRISLSNGLLAVQDAGRGIGAEELPYVFERHYRGRHSNGQGLGLYIVKRVCERMHWPIEASSEPDNGTCFTVRLGSGTA